MRQMLNDKVEACKFLMGKYQYWESIGILREPYDCFFIIYNNDNKLIPRSIVKELEEGGELSRECLEAIANLAHILEDKETKFIYEAHGYMDPEEGKNETNIR